ncbi:MAG: hypothetical protein QM777_10775 [Pseudorhodoferax sp.]
MNREINKVLERPDIRRPLPGSRRRGDPDARGRVRGAGAGREALFTAVVKALDLKAD